MVDIFLLFLTTPRFHSLVGMFKKTDFDKIGKLAFEIGISIIFGSCVPETMTLFREKGTKCV